MQRSSVVLVFISLIEQANLMNLTDFLSLFIVGMPVLAGIPDSPVFWPVEVEVIEKKHITVYCRCDCAK